MSWQPSVSAWEYDPATDYWPKLPPVVNGCSKISVGPNRCRRRNLVKTLGVTLTRVQLQSRHQIFDILRIKRPDRRLIRLVSHLEHDGPLGH